MGQKTNQSRLNDRSSDVGSAKRSRTKRLAKSAAKPFTLAAGGLLEAGVSFGRVRSRDFLVVNRRVPRHGGARRGERSRKGKG